MYYTFKHNNKRLECMARKDLNAAAMYEGFTYTVIYILQIKNFQTMAVNNCIIPEYNIGRLSDCRLDIDMSRVVFASFITSFENT